MVGWGVVDSSNIAELNVTVLGGSASRRTRSKMGNNWPCVAKAKRQSSPSQPGTCKLCHLKKEKKKKNISIESPVGAVNVLMKSDCFLIQMFFSSLSFQSKTLPVGRSQGKCCLGFIMHTATNDNFYYVNQPISEALRTAFGYDASREARS